MVGASMVATLASGVRGSVVAAGAGLPAGVGVLVGVGALAEFGSRGEVKSRATLFPALPVIATE